MNFSKQFFNLLIDISDVFPVSFVLFFFIPFLVGLLIFSAKLPIYFGFFSTFFLAQDFFDWRDCAWNCFSIFKNAVKLGIGREILIRLSGVLHVDISFDLFFRNLLELSTKLLDFILNFLEESNFVIFLLFWFLWQNGLYSFVKVINNLHDLLLVQFFGILHKLYLNIQQIIFKTKNFLFKLFSIIFPVFICMSILKYFVVVFLLSLKLQYCF